MRRLSALVFLTLLTSAVSCSHRSSQAAHEKHYRFSGKVVALNTRHRTATINGDAIPNFMEAMTMEYPIRDKDEFKRLHVGEKITATVNVNDDGEYNLSEVKEAALSMPKR